LNTVEDGEAASRGLLQKHSLHPRRDIDDTRDLGTYEERDLWKPKRIGEPMFQFHSAPTPAE